MDIDKNCKIAEKTKSLPIYKHVIYPDKNDQNDQNDKKVKTILTYWCYDSWFRLDYDNFKSFKQLALSNYQKHYPDDFNQYFLQNNPEKKWTNERIINQLDDEKRLLHNTTIENDFQQQIGLIIIITIIIFFIINFLFSFVRF